MPLIVHHRSPPPPDIDTAIAAGETAARFAMNAARVLGVSAIRQVEPRHSGRLQKGTTGRITRTQTGLRLTIGPSDRVRYPGGRGHRSLRGGVSAVEVWRFVDGGTGIYGPTGKKITRSTGKAFMLPRGAAFSFKGQRPQNIAVRGYQAADPQITRALEQGADRAAQAMQRSL